MQRSLMALVAVLAVTACAKTEQLPGEKWPEMETVTGSVYQLKDFPSAHLASQIVNVWLPPEYETSGNKRYPVLYMHDGHVVLEPSRSQYSHEEWGIDETITALSTDGIIEPAIVVAIETDIDRFDHLMPEKVISPEVKEWVEAQGITTDWDNAKGDDYLQFLVTELKPFIDDHFRTRPGREDTYIMGSSMGGLMSCYAFVEYPEVFGGIGCVSPHWPLGDGAVSDYVMAHLPTPGKNRVYFSYGTETLDEGYEPYQLEVDAAMVAAGYVEGEDFESVKFDGDEHSEHAWRRQMPVALTFLLGHHD